jgi:hypothetical protein
MMKKVLLLLTALLLFFKLFSQQSVPVEIKNVQLSILSKDIALPGPFKSTFSEKKINRMLLYDDGTYKIISIYSFRKKKNKTICKNGFEFYVNNKRIKDSKQLRNDRPFYLKPFSRTKWSGKSVDKGLRTLSMTTGGGIEIQRKSKKWIKIKCDYSFY